VAHEDDRTLLGVDDAFGRLDVAGERREGILDSDHVAAVPLQNRDDALPARAIGEGSVDEHDRRFCGTRRGSRGALALRGRSGRLRWKRAADEGGEDESRQSWTNRVCLIARILSCIAQMPEPGSAQ